MVSLQTIPSSPSLVVGFSSGATSMPTFDKTYTDADFQQEILRADSEWMSKHARPEPDLDVDGLKQSLLSRMLGLFSRPAQ